jgi:hypothetical protein
MLFNTSHFIITHNIYYSCHIDLLEPLVDLKHIDTSLTPLSISTYAADAIIAAAFILLLY